MSRRTKPSSADASLPLAEPIESHVHKATPKELTSVLNEVEGEAPGYCPACRRTTRRRFNSLFASCASCERTWTVWKLRRLVLEDADAVEVLAERVADRGGRR